MRSALYKRYRPIVTWVKNYGFVSCNVIVSNMLPCRVGLLVAVSVSASHTVGHTKDHQKMVGLQTTSL